ncbi:hypothetical protein DEU56DRAFT_832163 [Suillus clintonianus]|uniref:uncharacterized protein n=1 Tax=Suillus clintonianus TaxID=1904413 RepID=UPI001B86217D|nr:uncharacterized protein DEU56DRAFT_832163 [Suillus clintonianus]KAG2122496.1 hypothetical protein DEU56DRAFT_832163 [Suillus clintonianus]
MRITKTFLVFFLFGLCAIFDYVSAQVWDSTRVTVEIIFSPPSHIRRPRSRLTSHMLHQTTHIRRGNEWYD